MTSLMAYADLLLGLNGFKEGCNVYSLLTCSLTGVLKINLRKVTQILKNTLLQKSTEILTHLYPLVNDDFNSVHMIYS